MCVCICVGECVHVYTHVCTYSCCLCHVHEKLGWYHPQLLSLSACVLVFGLHGVEAHTVCSYVEH